MCSPYYENSIFSCFRNCIGFYFTRNRGVRNMWETQTFGIFLFSHNFSVLSKLTISMFWVLRILGILRFMLLAKYIKNTWLCNVLFFHTFHILSKITFPMFRGQTADVKTNEKCLFLIPFLHKCLCEAPHEGSQLILFLSPTQYQHFRSLCHRSK